MQRLAACAYWQAQAEQFDTPFLTTHHAELAKLAHVGLRHADSWVATADLLLALYFPIHNSLHWAEWLTLFQHALDHAQDDRRDLQYRLYSRLATLTHHIGDWEKSAEMHHHALDLAQSLNNLKGVGREHAHLCIVYNYLLHHDIAEKHGKTALDIFQELHLHPHFHVAALNSLGSNAYQKADFANAIEFFAEAVRVGQEDVPDTVIAVAYANWGNALRFNSEGVEAHVKYQNARQLAKRSPSSLHTILLDCGVCNLYLDQGRFSEAHSIIHKSTFDYGLAGMPVLYAANIAETIGRYYLLTNEIEQSIHHLKQAADYWQQTNIQSNRALVTSLLAIALQNHDSKLARKLNDQAEEMFQQKNLTDWQIAYQKCYQLSDISFGIQGRS